MLSKIIVIISFIYWEAVIAALNCSQFPTEEDLMECCKIPEPFSDAAEKCLEKYPNDGKLSFCRGDCILSALGFLVDGNIQSAKAPSIIDALLKTYPEFSTLAKTLYPKCEEYGKTQLAKLEEKKLEATDDCKPMPTLIASCLYREMFLNCPETFWVNRKSCGETKEYLKICAPLE